MPKMKLYASARRVLAPRPWIDALGPRDHVQQVEVAVVAASKDDAARLLDAAGADSHVTSSLRLMRGPEHPRALALLLRYRVITMDEPAVYAWEAAVAGYPVLWIGGDWYEIAGRFLSLPPGAPLTVALAAPGEQPKPLVPGAVASADAAGRTRDPVRPGATAPGGSATPSRGEGE
jgi:hypothetical protein